MIRTKLSLALVLSGALMGCSGGGGGGGSKTPPVLQNLGLEFAAWDGNPGSNAGAFSFDVANPDHPFVAFGVLDSGHLFVNIEFKPRVDANVISPMDGVVTTVAEQETPEDGYELHIQEESGAKYMVILDHVRNVTVEEGDTVTAGEVLGIPGDWAAIAGQYEIQVNDDVHDTYACPMTFLAPEVAAPTAAALTQLMSDWEDFKADSTIFDEASMTVPGCLVETLEN